MLCFLASSIQSRTKRDLCPSSKSNRHLSIFPANARAILTKWLMTAAITSYFMGPFSVIEMALPGKIHFSMKIFFMSGGQWV